jgi:hypothetical protein
MSPKPTFKQALKPVSNPVFNPVSNPAPKPVLKLADRSSSEIHTEQKLL